MKQSVMLRSASVLSVLFFLIHLVDDIIRGFEKGGADNLAAIPIFVVWLCGALVLAERRSGYVIMLLGGLFGMLPALAHMRGRGLGAASIAGSSGGFFFVFTTIAMAVTALFAFILAAQGLWNLRRGGPGLNEG
jgi:hypothetical protein